MKPATIKDRDNFIDESSLFEDDTMQNKEDDGLSEEDLKIESLKIATNICKLMNDVLPDDIIEVAAKVASFIKNGGGDLTSNVNDTDSSEFDNVDDTSDDDTSDFEEDFATDDEENTENTEEDNTSSEEDTEENFEV